MIKIKELLAFAAEHRASDLHITVNAPPVLRIDGTLRATPYPRLTTNDTKTLVYEILSEDQRNRFENERELDLSFSLPGIGRFRVNVHRQRGSTEAAFRIIPHEVMSLEELGLPKIVSSLARLDKGLVIVTGPVGMGKTSTMAAMVDLINNEKSCLVITIEDPIEYVHHHKKSIIKQRELYADTNSFANALKYALRQDPNVIVVGEMRDLETIGLALTAAETGHLVLTTLHTPTSYEAVNRIVDVFPPYQQQQIRIQLGAVLQGIVAQILLPRSSGEGRVLASEMLIATPAIKNMIRESETDQIYSALQTGTQAGMRTMDKSLKELYRQNLISLETAKFKVRSMAEFESS